MAHHTIKRIAREQEKLTSVISLMAAVADTSLVSTKVCLLKQTPVGRDVSHYLRGCWISQVKHRARSVGRTPPAIPHYTAECIGEQAVDRQYTDKQTYCIHKHFLRHMKKMVCLDTGGRLQLSAFISHQDSPCLAFSDGIVLLTKRWPQHLVLKRRECR